MSVIRRGISYSKRKINKLRRTARTWWLNLIKASDQKRWANEKSLFQSWDERTRLLADCIEPNSRVFEFGAARLALKQMLPEGCTYFHSDIAKRADDTLVADLNKELPKLPKVDYVVFSGVLEYIYDVSRILEYAARSADHILFSYATTDAFDSVNERRYNGWVSDLGSDDIAKVAEAIGYRLSVIGHWKNQTLYKFSS